VSGPRRLDESINRILDDLGAAPVRQTDSLLSRWSEVVGEELAAHTTPLGVRHGVLLAEADDPAHASMLEWQERQVIERLSAGLGPDVVTRLRVRVKPPG